MPSFLRIVIKTKRRINKEFSNSVIIRCNILLEITTSKVEFTKTPGKFSEIFVNTDILIYCCLINYFL